MTLNREAPPFYFAPTKVVLEAGHFRLEEEDLAPGSFVPRRGNPKDTGYDVRCAVPGGVELIPGGYVKIPLGIRMFAPDGWWLSLAPRSSTFARRYIHALYGVIDETYENELCFVGQYLPAVTGKVIPANVNPVIRFGERIAQVIPVPRWEADMIGESNEQLDSRYADRKGTRGTGGFGSSGYV